MVSKMKIYEIGTGYTPIPARMGAATEIVVEELVKSFQKLGQDVELIDIEAKDRLPNTLPITQVKVPSVFTDTDVKLGIMHKLKRVVYSVSLAMKLKKILKQAHETVLLHFHNQYNLYFFLKLVSPKLRRKAKIAYTVHSYIWPAPWEEIKDTVHKRYFQEIECVRKADMVLVLNDRTAEHFVNHLGVDSGRIHKINNGVNTDIYHIQPQQQREAFIRSLGLSGKRIIFQVGSVCDRKNQLGAVKMLKDYLREHPDVVYLYAGGVIDAEYQASITAIAAENGIAQQVRYAGELSPGEELNAYYNSAVLTVFPSKLESFGLVIIESLAAGRPVILAEKPLFALEHGCHVYDDEQAFVQLVDSLLRQQTWDHIAREEVIRQYSWDKVAGDHVDIWNR
jgi:glycosyltransferase involved in cell wall biosynthesis